MLIIEKLKVTDDNFFYLHEYHPYNTYGPAINEIDKKIMNIKSKPKEDWQIRKKKEAIGYFLNEIREVIKDVKEEIVVVVVPSSNTKNIDQGIKILCKELSKDNDLIDGTECLIRIIDVQAQHEGGTRDEQIHLDTIILDKEELIKNKKVLLIDDVTTSGGTFKACKKILLRGNPKEIYCLAIGKTV